MSGPAKNRLAPITLPIVLIFVMASVKAHSSKPEIHGVDFRNFSFPWKGLPTSVPSTWHWIATRPEKLIELKNGRYEFAPPEEAESNRPSLVFREVVYGNFNGTSDEAAAVVLSYHTGGTANWDYVYAYENTHGTLKLLGVLESGSRAEGGLIQVSIKGGLLILDFADKNRRVADCCSEGFVRVRYRWQGSHFAPDGPQEYGDLNPPA
jgi:hypothetical protein